LDAFGKFFGSHGVIIQHYLKGEKIMSIILPREGAAYGVMPQQMGVLPDTLTIACKMSDLDEVKLVISKGGRPDASTLDWAVRSGNKKIVQAVIASGALPTAQTLTLACSPDIDIAILKAISVANANLAKELIPPAFQLKEP
jgi:hypothetical protein